METQSAYPFDLSPAEKLQLVEDLWDNLASTPVAVPVQEWQITELQQRKAHLADNPSSALSWGQTMANARNRLRHSQWHTGAIKG